MADKVYDSRRTESFTFDNPVNLNQRKITKPFGMSLTGVNCLTEGVDTSAVIVVDACDSNGGNCVFMLTAPITCGPTKTVGSLSTATLPAGGYLRIGVGAVVGSPVELYVSVDYTVTRE
jgi:hypothetical protein